MIAFLNRSLRSVWRALRRPTGLRGRLVITFILVAMTASALVAGIGYTLVKSALINRTESAAVSDVLNTLEQITVPIGALWPGELPPTGEDLNNVHRSLGAPGREVIVSYQESIYPGARMRLADVPYELRAQAPHRVVSQRARIDDRTWLVVGTQVHRLARNGSVQPTGMTVFVFVSLADEERILADLRDGLTQAGAITLFVGLTGALLSARRVLLPVRRLGSAARALGEGRLDTRLPVHGHDELARLTATFNESASALEKSVSELRALEAISRRFVADVSHELRTPLAAMTAVTDMLREEADRLPSEPAQAVRLVLGEIERLRVLVEHLIEASRLDAGTATLRVERVNVADALTDCLEMRGWADQVRLNVSEGLSFTLDPRRFDVILANLVGNALRHGAPPVLVSARGTPNGLEVKVRDHGKGIPDEALPHVFDRFFKAEAGRARSEGSGLGLSIARANARLHGGTISVRRQDPGTLFTVWLPHA
ncbi:HAMP domain-containing sensor histidine kinase [Spongiactinospora sp. TRM90649]|uniref:sensor histidine kinase n=1 Tax=Spongiactinospora sp. TRM90649 TaxID=3031114 RepID=UPI0023F80D4C|nr:HAMP domain-containing sensor histidine kinase [Spongiactinospora sp. TRM90649]MDF5754742.1 HAMP domain-containing sensor histidine kinase [Spongiactinospora sp. TRM90649]